MNAAPAQPEANRVPRLPDGQEAVITVWADGGWKLWGAMDAHYAQNDPDWVGTIPVADVLPAVTAEAAKGGVGLEQFGCWAHSRPPAAPGTA